MKSNLSHKNEGSAQLWKEQDHNQFFHIDSTGLMKRVDSHGNLVQKFEAGVTGKFSFGKRVEIMK